MDNEDFKMSDGEDVTDTDLRDVLLSLPEKGEIKHTDKYIKKANHDTLLKIKKDYDRRKLDVANEFISENLISKFSELMKSLELVDDSKDMEEELTGNHMLKIDLKNIVGNITPLLCGGVVVAKDVINKKYNGKQEQQDESKQGD